MKLSVILRVIIVSFIISIIHPLCYAKVGVNLFHEDFEWLEPWTRRALSPVENNDNTLNIYNLYIKNSVENGVSAYDALLAHGYDFEGRYIDGSTYEIGSVVLLKNYLGFGYWEMFSGMSFTVDGSGAENLYGILKFDWCPLNGKGEIDPTKLVVIVNNGENEYRFDVPEHNLNKGDALRWIPVEINIGNILRTNTRITIRNADEQWPGSGVPVKTTWATYCIDNISVDATYSQAIFHEDFEWLEPWSSLTPAGSTVEDDAPDATAQQLGTNKVDGLSTYDALLARGYSFPFCCSEGKSPRLPQAQAYLQRNYIKFGLTGYYTGFSFNVDGSNIGDNDAILTFSWCPMITGSHNFDQTKLVVIVESEGEEYHFDVPEHTLKNGEPMAWIPVTINLGKILRGNSRITIRNADEQWPDTAAKAYRYFLDDISVQVPAAGCNAVLTFSNTDRTCQIYNRFKIPYSLVLTNDAVKVESIQWQSSNESVAVVDQDGEISTIGVGKSSITLTIRLDNGEEYKSSSMINVRDLEVGDTFEFDGLPYTVKEERCLTLNYIKTPIEGHFDIPGILMINKKMYMVTALDKTFYEHTNLTSVSIPETVLTIDNYAFYKTSITEITLPLHLQTLGIACFRYSKIKSINIPEGVSSLGYGCFYHCDSLENVNLPSSMENLGEGNIFSYSSIKSIVLPENLKVIGNSAFNHCSMLESLFIPKNAGPCDYASYGDNPAPYCTSLAYIEVDAENKYYTTVDGVLFDKEMKTLVTYPAGKESEDYIVPEGIEDIVYNAFAGSKIRSVKFPEGMTESPFPGISFLECFELETIKLPSTAAKLQFNYLDQCEKLSRIYCAAQTPPALSISLIDYNNESTEIPGITVYVPYGTKEAYEASTWANYFSSFVEYDTTTGIEEIQLDQNSSNPSTPVIYNMQGMRVANPLPGEIYIVDGKKMIIKH